MGRMSEMYQDQQEQKRISDLERDSNELECMKDHFSWQPIETAPKDETHLLLYFSVTNLYGSGKWYVSVGEFWKGEWYTLPYMHAINEPTHWMPLPEPPQ